MKKNTILLSTAIICICLMAFSFGNKEIYVTPPVAEYENVYTNFFYDFSTRFDPVTKSVIEKATSVTDFYGEDHLARMVELKETALILVVDDKQTETRAYGESLTLTSAQLDLLKSADYSTHFLIRTEFYTKDEENGEWVFNFISPHLTVVPETQAFYKPSKEKLLAYFAKHNKENTLNLNESILQPAKLHFTITVAGEITNARLDRTSGYPEIDKTMIDLLTQTQGKWVAAKNAQGEKVDQELVITFGMVGC